MDTSLQCIICPEQPRFSDSSHLLTHLASKAHLSNTFKLTVAGHHDPNATQLLEEYELWSKANDIPRQLAGRMSNKQSRNKKRKSDDNNENPPKKRATDVSVSTSTASIAHCIDPRITDPFFGKHEDTDHPTFTPINTPKASTNIVRSAQSSTGPSLRSRRFSNNWQSVSTPVPKNSDYPALPVTPTRPRSRRKPEEIAWTASRDTPDANELVSHRSDGVVDKARADEMARLKGVLWPGMDIFDSATLKMKLKRNQKKDGSSLKRMELTSLLVTPTEMVFSPSGTIRKLRVISGNVEDHSPLKGETPIPRRHFTRPKKPILERADPNVLRAVDRKRTVTTANKSTKNTKETPKKPRRSSRRSQCTTERPVSYPGEDDEMDLAVQAFGKKSQGGFRIFTDEDDHKFSPKDNQQPSTAYFDTLTPKRLVLNGKPNAFGMHGSKIGKTATDKENIEPILDPHGRIDAHGWYSPLAKRSAIDQDHSPEYFFDESVLDEPYRDFNKTGYNANPLLAPSNSPVYGNSYNDGHMDQTSWESMGHPAPSEETISEGDQHDFSLLYFPANID
jgi:hypothetical protein